MKDTDLYSRILGLAAPWFVDAVKLKGCPCGAELVRIGEEVSEKLDIVPAKIQVIRHILILLRSCGHGVKPLS